MKRVAKRAAGLLSFQSLSSQFQFITTWSPFSMRYGTWRLPLRFCTNIYRTIYATTPRVLLGPYRIRYLKYHSTVYQVSSFFDPSIALRVILSPSKDEVSTDTMLSQAVTGDTLDVWILDSVAKNHDLPHDSPTTRDSIPDKKTPGSHTWFPGEKTKG